MNKVHTFDPVIYPRILWVSYYPETFNDIFEDVSEFDKDGAAAMVDFTFDKTNRLGGILIRFRSKADMTTENIAHESLHAAYGILGYCGVDVDADNNEALAYLTGWVAKCCEKVKRHKNK